MNVSQLPILVINLARAGDRWEKIQTIFSDHDLNYQRLDAIDAQLQPELCAANTTFPMPMRKWFRPLTQGEVACGLSHKKAWQRIIDEQWPYALVLEDDILPLDAWLDGLETILQSDVAFDAVKLSQLKPKHFVVKQQLNDTFSLGRTYPVQYGAIATLYSQSGAQKLLNGVDKILRPIDFELKNFWEHDLNLYSLSPSIFTVPEDQSDEESYIGERRQYRKLPVLQRVRIYARKYVYEVIHRLNWMRAKARDK